MFVSGSTLTLTHTHICSHLSLFTEQKKTKQWKEQCWEELWNKRFKRRKSRDEEKLRLRRKGWGGGAVEAVELNQMQNSVDVSQQACTHALAMSWAACSTLNYPQPLLSYFLKPQPLGAFFPSLACSLSPGGHPRLVHTYKQRVLLLYKLVTNVNCPVIIREGQTKENICIWN